MATQTYHKPPPSLCHVPPTHTAQIATAIGDLLDDLQWVQFTADFLAEQLTDRDHHWRPCVLIQALDDRLQRYRTSLHATLELVRENGQ